LGGGNSLRRKSTIRGACPRNLVPCPGDIDTAKGCQGEDVECRGGKVQIEFCAASASISNSHGNLHSVPDSRDLLVANRIVIWVQPIVSWVFIEENMGSGGDVIGVNVRDPARS